MPRTTPRMVVASRSDVGPARENNEDRVYVDAARGIFAVVDGMGGHNAGEEAAAIAVERLRSRLERQTGSSEQRLREAIVLANNAIYEAGQERPEWRGMACVLTVALVENGQAVVGHVGDSRLYKIRRGLIEKITRDHSPVGEREDRGELTEAQAMAHPRRNEVYRDVGSEQRSPYDPDFIEITELPFETDSALLLCSDGLSDVVPSAQILGIVEQFGNGVEDAVEELVAAANRQSKDNVSVVLIAGEAFGGAGRAAVTGGGGSGAEEQKPVRMFRGLWWAYVLLGGVLGAALMFVIMRSSGVDWRTLLAGRAEQVQGPEVLRVGPQGGDYASIEAALAAARPGDTVEVAPGEYRESVRLPDGVTLLAQSPRLSVLRPAAGATDPVAVRAENVKGGRISGFLIRGDEAAPLAVGILVRNSQVVVDRVEVTGARLAGIEYAGGSTGTLSASQVHHNAGAGVIIHDPAAPTLENNLITENGKTPQRLRPGVEILSRSRPQLVGNIIADNGAEPVWHVAPVDEAMLNRNFFSLEGRPPARNKVRTVPPEGTR
jgi:PPM family protein phosphatase